VKLKMNKDILVVILLIALIALAGFTYNIYSKAKECEVIATDLGTRLVECGAGVNQLQSGLNECLVGATQCQEALASLQEMCAPYLPTQ
jgi:hypothetical protein